MSFIFTLLLILLVWWIFRPIILGIANARRMQREFQNMMNNAAHAGARPGERKGGWSRKSAPRKKKIDKNTGEYVEFSEITVEQNVTTGKTAGDNSCVNVETEQQIVDAEWEDID